MITLEGPWARSGLGNCLSIEHCPTTPPYQQTPGTHQNQPRDVASDHRWVQGRCAIDWLTCPACPPVCPWLSISPPCLHSPRPILSPLPPFPATYHSNCGIKSRPSINSFSPKTVSVLSLAASQRMEIARAFCYAAQRILLLSFLYRFARAVFLPLDSSPRFNHSWGKDGRNFYRAIWSKDLEKRNCIIISIGYSSNLLRENKYSEENDRYYVLIDCFISITYWLLTSDSDILLI